MFTFKTVDNKPLSFFSNMQLSYSTNVVLGATPRTCLVGPLLWNKPHAVGMCQKPESPFLPRRNLNLDTRRCYTYSRCRSQKPPRPAPHPVLAQHRARTAHTVWAPGPPGEPVGITRLQAFPPEPPFSCLFCHHEASKIFFELLCIVTLSYKK